MVPVFFLGFYFFVLVVVWVGSAIIASDLAKAKGLNASTWAITTFLLGPIGLIGVAGMPDIRLRSYMRSIAIKLEAIEEQESTQIETMPVSIPTPVSSRLEPSYIYIDEGVDDRQQILAVVFQQLTEKERMSASLEASDVRIGRMAFINTNEGKVLLRLSYVGRKDGRHIYKKS
ncbi:putative conserved membrane protein [Synechococcus sp. A15-127]|uniref:hypothetical protein n=1 Tax=Synechococcus sp. A15-127 TaxID=1050624 RepID=UPI001648C0F3|nr:hypothetical protein [Synechococcus sp. A15-127]QNI94545.1 putative conserved membrane protein [Synechococcus sp. A15-127]